jgi:putative ABC transport system permease protein
LTVHKLARNGLRHHWRTNLAAAAGVAIAVAVLAGAYNVGQSVRASLRSLALARLGATQFAVASNTSFREALLPECPLIALEAVVTHPGSGRRASRVALYAVDQRFWRFHQRAMQAPGQNEFLLSDALASELKAQSGDQMLVRVALASAIPTESLHGRKEDPGRTIRGTMRAVVSRDAMGEFSLRPQQDPVKAIFVNLQRFQRDLDLDGRVNTALTSNSPDRQIRTGFTLDDLGLRVRDGMVEHASMMLDDSLVKAVFQADSNAQPVFTYLANSIRINSREIPYSVVTAMDRPELGSDNDIVLNHWAAADLNAKPGDTVSLEFYVWEPSGRLVTKTASFRNAGTVPIEEWQRRLAPEYPGISGARAISDWDPPFPINLGRIRKADEEYWNRYRATPKAFIRLAAGQRLWKSRFGAVTGMRTAATETPLRAAIDPLTVLNLQDVRQANLDASHGATDFGEYFLYFSFFLVISSLLLASMFFRFAIEQRMPEIATLRAVGWGIHQIRKLLIIESMYVAGAGAIAGALLAFAYSGAVVYALKTWWVEAVGTRDLHVIFSPLSLGVGVCAGFAMALIVVAGALRVIGRQSPRASGPRHTRAHWWALAAFIGSLALLLLGGAGGFFGGGALLLISALALLFSRIKRASGRIGSIGSLGVRYTSHRPGRAILCIALIASATFLIVAVDAFRRPPALAENGYRYVAESALPIYYDPNTQDGREALNLDTDTKWLSFRLRHGDDASCLNLYQPQNPRVLGAPASWMNLPRQSDGAIPAAVDANTLEYVLHRKIGDWIQVGPARLKIVKALPDTVFQSEMIINDADFQKAFPEEQGFRVFLIDSSQAADAQLETALEDYGLDVTSVADRIAAFHRVENTYLSTFQSLGALGLLLGTAGVAAVLLRNVLERRRELALLRASGFNAGDLSKMILAENAFLVFAGLVIGAACASIAVLPTVLRRGGTPPVLALIGLLFTVAAAGFLTSLVAVRGAIRAPILNALRSE